MTRPGRLRDRLADHAGAPAGANRSCRP
jgi:hypothetical protein